MPEDQQLVLPGVRPCSVFEDGMLHLWMGRLVVHPLDWGKGAGSKKAGSPLGTTAPRPFGGAYAVTCLQGPPPRPFRVAQVVRYLCTQGIC